MLPHRIFLVKTLLFVFLFHYPSVSSIAQQEKLSDTAIQNKEELVKQNIAQIKAKVKRQPTEALELFHETLTIYNDVLTEKETAGLLATMAEATVFTHTFFAREMAQKAGGIVERASITDPSLNALIHHSIGYTYLAQGEFQQALTPFRKNLELIIQQDSVNYTSLQKSYSNLATAYNYTRNADSALKYSELALKTTQRHAANNPIALASNYGNLSRAVTLRGDIDSAIVLRKKSLSIHEEQFGPKGHKTATDYYYLGSLYSMKGNFTKALSYAQKCMLTNYPEIKQDQPNNYLPPKISKHTNTNGVLQALMLKIHFFETLYKREQDSQWLKTALTHYTAVDTLVNILQQSQPEKDLARLIAINREGYNAAVALTFQLDQIDKKHSYDEKIYAFANATKGKLLSYQVYKMKDREKDTSEINPQLSRLEISLRELKNQIQVAGGKKKDSLQNLALAKKAKLIGMKNKVKTSSERGVGIDLNRFKIKLSQIREQLTDDEALIEYTETGDYLNIFCNTSTKTIIKRVKKDSSYYASYRHFMKSIKTGASKTDAGLSEYLLTPVSEHIADKQHLVVIPENNLYNLPFEALITPGQSKAMIHEHSFSYHYAAKLWAETRKETSKPANPNIALFAPGFMNENIAELAENNAYRGDEILQTEGIFDRKKQQLVALPHSLDEVSQISRMFEQNSPKPYLMTGRKATEENFRKIPSTDIIHVATHGISYKKYPGESGLFFSQSKDREARQHTEDGFLFVNELFSMQIETDLVVLSACKSGTGKIMEGEGVFGLPRGFIFAGVPNLVASLWKVHDKKTKILITSFYRQLLEGKDYATALQQSKLEMIENGELPMDWSGIVLIGR